MVAEEMLTAAGVGDINVLMRFDPCSLTDTVCDTTGCNCLHYAARQGGVELLNFLVNDRGFAGSKRSNIGATAAHDAAAAGNLEALQWLIQHAGCRVDDQDGTGTTALHLASRFHHTRVTEWLLDVAHADTSMRTASNAIALHFAVVGDDYDAVKLLVEEDPMSVNQQLNNGATATYLAAQEGHIEILRSLIQDHQGNVRMKAYDGMSCVHAAAQSGHLDCVRFLIDEDKCNANDRDFDGATPLHYAASQGHALVIDWLMRVGGARVTLDNLGGSPLHNAAECNHLQCVTVLINNNHSTQIEDNNGLTAVELAHKCYNEKCANLIETFIPQCQFVIDEDVACHHSVQSPRHHSRHSLQQQQAPAVYNGYTCNNLSPSISPSKQQSKLQNDLRRTAIGQVHQEVSPEPNYDKFSASHSHILNGSYLSDAKSEEEEDDTVSIVDRADSDEFPVSVPRNLTHNLFMMEDKRDLECYSQSDSSLSVNELSHLDDVIAVASQAVTTHQTTPGTSEYKKSENQGFHRIIPLERSLYKSTDSVDRNILGKGGKSNFTIFGQKDAKTVKFQSDQIYQTTNSVSEGIKSDNSQKPYCPRDAEQVTSWSVDFNQPFISPSIVRSTVSTVDNTPVVVVNGKATISPPEIPTLHCSTPTTSLPPAAVHSDQLPSDHVPQLLGYSNERSVIPAAPPAPPVPRLLGSINHSDTQPSAPQLLGTPQRLGTGNQSDYASPPPSGIENKSLSDEIKRKSASLPARSTAVFTAEKMKSRPSTLSPGQAHTLVNTRTCPDFLTELKQATRGPVWRKTSIPTETGTTSLTPAMTFSSAQKKSVVMENKLHDKVELTGEWDPKRFMNDVPNKDSLPAWMVQLQARHLAEKTRQEYLEQQKIDAHESRFRNMPAWKRAIVEKKEADIRAAEEQGSIEQQTQKRVERRCVAVVAVTTDRKKGGKLAPWQQELQER